MGFPLYQNFLPLSVRLICSCSFALAMKVAQTQNDHGPHRSSPLQSNHFHYPYPAIDPSLRSPLSFMPEPSIVELSEYDPSQATSSTLATTPAKPYSSFAFSPSTKGNADFRALSWLDSIVDGTGGPFTGPMDFNIDDSSIPMQFASDQAQLLSLESPEHSLTGSSSAPGVLKNLMNPIRREPQLEDVTSWANISHFISLFLQYLYPLLPLVHRPTFAEHLATRRDLRDTDFRALLLSIGKYLTRQMKTR